VVTTLPVLRSYDVLRRVTRDVEASGARRPPHFHPLPFPHYY